MAYYVRAANIDDILEITEIYNQGIEDRATLVDTPKTESEMQEWFQVHQERYKVLVAVDEADRVWGWTSLNVYNPKACYSGVADISVYIERGCRGQGLGKLLLTNLEKVAREQGFHKLVLTAFPFNPLSMGLYITRGFREVGTYIDHGLLDGKWVDVVVMEKLLHDRVG